MISSGHKIVAPDLLIAIHNLMGTVLLCSDSQFCALELPGDLFKHLKNYRWPWLNPLLKILILLVQGTVWTLVFKARGV